MQNNAFCAKFLFGYNKHPLISRGGGDRPIPFRSESATDHIVRAKILA